MTLPEAAHRSGRPEISIIIPCWNQVEYTRECVKSVFRFTRLPFEVVLVDNGSTDDTPELARVLAERHPECVRIITNAENRGYPAACNQGLAIARGDVLVLMNSDVVLCEDWANQGVALLNSARDVGMCGPMSNYASPPQLVPNVGYRDLDDMHRFAAEWRKRHAGQWFEAPKLSGFLVFLKRAAFETIGGLDEQFGLGMFDDDDMSMRCRKAGYRLVVAMDWFVHHFGSRSFIGGKIDTEALLRENQAKFAAKHGEDVIRGQVRVAITPWANAPPSQSPEPGRRARTSLVLIVRNEAANLGTCLESARDLFDEIVVVDTGSADETKEIARRYGARVFDFPWCDDFAAARNAALSRATGDFVFSIDADDLFTPEAYSRTRDLLATLHPDGKVAYVVRISCDPNLDGTGGNTVVDHVRLFPRLDGQVYWEYRVHEQILPSLQRAGVKIAWSNVVLRHTGYSVPDIRKRKLARDGAILRQELAERPGHPFTLFNMGALAMQDEDWAAALEHINASLRASAPSDSIVNKLYAMAAQCHRMRGEHPLSLAACAKGLETTPDDAELLFRKGLVLRDMGDQAGAEACWRRVLSLQRPNRFGSVDQGIYTHLPRRNLAIVVAERGDRAEARRLWSEVLAECPNDRDTLRALARLDAEESGQAASDPDTGWLMADSCRARLPEPPEDAEGDFTPFAPAAAAWVRALDAKVIVALGVRFGDSARSLLDAAHETEGHVWGVDSVPRHDVADQRFTYLAEDPLPSAGRWERIDLLHVEVDPNTGDLPSRWLDPYKAKCRAIALAGTHHPSFGTSAAARQLAASGDWRAFEYRAGYCGWTVLVRHGEPTPDAKIIGPDAPPMSPPESACCDPRGLYLNLLERTLADAIYDGRNEPIRLQGLDWPQRAHTMIGLRRLRHLRRCVERALADGIPGDLMETGVWRGGAAILMRGALDAYGDSQRRVWAADSFRGVPPPDPERYPVDAGDRHHQARALAVGLDDVKENFRRYGLLDDRVCFLEGWFRDTLPAAPVERLAVLRLDGDLYESTMVALESLYDRVSPGGFVIVDDYGAIAPCRQAVHNFRATRGISEPLRPIDWAAAYWRRAASE